MAAAFQAFEAVRFTDARRRCKRNAKLEKRLLTVIVDTQSAEEGANQEPGGRERRDPDAATLPTG
jgi:hypothetical protein